MKPAGYNGINLPPLALAAQSPAQSPGKAGQAKQGFMPYKWHAQQAQLGGAQQLSLGVSSLGKRSASASLLEAPRKRPYSGGLP